MNVLNARLLAKTPVRKPVSKPKEKVKQAPRSVSPGLPPRVLTALHLGIFFTLLLLLRWGLFDLPLERDESAYAYLGKRALEGLAPYRDFYEMKPPLLFYAYALLIKVFGYSLGGLRWASFALVFVNTWSIYGFTSVLVSKKTGFAAGILYLLMTVNPYANAIVTDAELVQMGLVLPGLWLLARYLKQLDVLDFKPGIAFTTRHLVPAGALLCAAVLVKQSGVFFVLFALLALLIGWLYRSGRSFFKGLVPEGTWLAAGAAIPLLLCINILSAYGVWSEFWLWNAVIPGEYVSTISDARALELFRHIFHYLTKSYEVLWLLGGLGCAALFLKNTAPAWVRWVLAAFILCSAASVFPGRRFYGHYWLQFIPALAVLGAYALFALEKWLSHRGMAAGFRPVLPYAVLAFVVFFILYKNKIAWQNPNVDVIIDRVYGGNRFADAKKISGFLAKSMKPQDQFLVLGSEPEFYVYLNKKAPTRHFYMAFLGKSTDRAIEWQKEALEDIKNKRPEYLVYAGLSISWSLQAGDSRLLYEESFRWSIENYVPVYWVEYSQGKKPVTVSGAEALQFKPARGSEYYLAMRRKDYQ